ncbi:phage tail protein, partial [Enterococcus durans]
LLELLMIYHQQKFPGLGVLKKWTLLHHLELISQLLDRPDSFFRNDKRVEVLYSIVEEK